MRARSALTRLTAALAVSLVAPAAFAGVITAGTGSTTQGGSVVIPLSFTGDGETVDFQGDVLFDAAQFTVTTANANGGQCSVPSAGTVRIVAPAGQTNPLPAGPTTYCNVTFTAGAATPFATYPLDVTGELCFEGDGTPPEAGCTGTDGSITVQAGPSAPQLTFNPPAGGTVTLNTGGAGTIAVTAGAGSPGETAALTCSSTNGTATVTGSPFAPNGTGSIAVQCTPVVGATAPFTVNCNVDQSVGTDQGAVTFNATCPAITPSPEFNANLNVSLTGSPGSTLTGGATISNTGNAPLTVGPCTVTGAFTVTPPASIPAGGTGTLGVSCVAPASAGAIATGTAVCTTNDPDDGEGSVTFTLSCGAQILAVPAMGSFGKGILAALLAGLGLLVFAMRRRASV
jgi:hypothetical protein